VRTLYTLIMVILGDAGDDRAYVIERDLPLQHCAGRAAQERGAALGTALERRVRVLCLEQPVVDWRER